MNSLDSSGYALPRPRAPRAPAPIGAAPDSRDVVAQRLRARRRKVSLIRRRVIALALAMFMAISGWILVRLATGHDPALVSAAARNAAATAGASSSGTGTASSGGTASSTNGSASGSSGSGSTSSSQSSASGSTSSVTTSAS